MICCSSSTAIVKFNFWKRAFSVLFPLFFTIHSFSQLYIGDNTPLVVSGQVLIASEETELHGEISQISQLIVVKEEPKLVYSAPQKSTTERTLAFSQHAMNPEAASEVRPLEIITEANSESVVFKGSESEEKETHLKLLQRREHYSRMLRLNGIAAAPASPVRNHQQNGSLITIYFGSSPDSGKSMIFNSHREYEEDICSPVGSRAPPFA